MASSLIQGREHDLGHGLMVRRSLPAASRQAIGPFVFFDHAGPAKMDVRAGRQADIRPHPHIGLSTVSYLLSGAVRHRDNLGLDQVIHPGDINWMTAGRGIVHSERFDVAGAFDGKGLELLQCWVALPDADEEMPPQFSHHDTTSLPAVTDTGLRLRLLLGEAWGLKSPVPTLSPLFYAHAELKAGAHLEVPAHYSERAAYVVRGRVHNETDHLDYGERQLFLLGKAGNPVLRAAEDSTVMLFGGEPLGTRYLWWNLVSSRKERIRQAAADWEAGRFKLPESDHAEFIPLPEPVFG